MHGRNLKLSIIRFKFAPPYVHLAGGSGTKYRKDFLWAIKKDFMQRY